MRQSYGTLLQLSSVECYILDWVLSNSEKVQDLV